MTKEYKKLIHFYKQVALIIIKSSKKRVSLIELEERFYRKKDAIYGWMQWSDAKAWFRSAISDGGTSYTLHPEYVNLTVGEMLAKMNEYYGLYQEK